MIKRINDVAEEHAQKIFSIGLDKRMQDLRMMNEVQIKQLLIDVIAVGFISGALYEKDQAEYFQSISSLEELLIKEAMLKGG